MPVGPIIWTQIRNGVSMTQLEVIQLGHSSVLTKQSLFLRGLQGLLRKMKKKRNTQIKRL